MSETLTMLGNRIRELRKKKGLSQEKLAQRSNISPKYVGEIERGEVNISVSVLTELANALDTTVAELMENRHTADKSELLAEIEAYLKKADNGSIRKIYLFIKHFC
ncbi:helix-turn-helix domain-containing protein [Seleniivibrio woodruffii]|uniref:Helix-turn-helix protein n=2 Tax=Seleniivibrio woodruffii TaxID=1078050 RepID=A0A4R1K7S5_9BACT|nr:helix-turn-helix transcriptional regulator [Seleniivibrio woodruffii]TCK59853.1 helix-turn-helix protein [Seleniivibrio woodruffii]TVZ35926.1 helix-turn-helix protein [Seleniivibrio woodruffii]